MRASLLALPLLAACSGGDTVGGLTRDEAERLNQAAEMLDQREARFEDRAVDEAPAEKPSAGEDDAPADEARD